MEYPIETLSITFRYGQELPLQQDEVLDQADQALVDHP